MNENESIAHLTRLITLLFICLSRLASSEKHVEMKIVDEPSSFGGNYAYNSLNNFQADDNLVLRVQPANFSGPQHFKRLIGRCFEAEIKDYKYKFCPYHNITQHEQGVHWNPYKGVLGVWQEWEVKDNTFIAMLMKDGDVCGDLYRSVRVSFLCGNHSAIVNVTEPSRCNYHMDFRTPLVCAQDSMLVYPSVDPNVQHLWDVLEGERVAGELTDKGYKKRLEKVFEKAGIYLSKQDRHVLVKKAEEEKKIKMSDAPFETLSHCQTEYNKLKEEIKSLKARLKANENAESEQTSQSNGTDTQNEH